MWQTQKKLQGVAIDVSGVVSARRGGHIGAVTIDVITFNVTVDEEHLHMITVYQYPNCSTCRRAIKWLDAHGVDYKSVHIVDAPPSKTKLKKLHKQSGQDIKKLFNTSGQSYRNGGFKDSLPGMSDDEKFDALAKDGKLIKRPLVDAGDTTLIGFKEAEWEAALG
mgnify:CR=1 FL=1